MKSAETRAKEFCELYHLFGTAVKQLTTMFKEHERDTQDAVVEALSIPRKYSVNIGAHGGWPQQIETVNFSTICGLVETAEVIDD